MNQTSTVQSFGHESNLPHSRPRPHQSVLPRTAFFPAAPSVPDSPVLLAGDVFSLQTRCPGRAWFASVQSSSYPVPPKDPVCRESQDLVSCQSGTRFRSYFDQAYPLLDLSRETCLDAGETITVRFRSRVHRDLQCVLLMGVISSRRVERGGCSMGKRLDQGDKVTRRRWTWSGTICLPITIMRTLLPKSIAKVMHDAQAGVPKLVGRSTQCLWRTFHTM